MTTVGVYASRVHYRQWAEAVAVASGLPWVTLERGDIKAHDGAVLVASHRDSVAVKRYGAEVITLSEHGVGASYLRGRGRHPGYSGGNSRGHIGCYLAPGHYSAALELATRPKATVIRVGLPILDGIVALRDGGPAGTFHWRAPVVPESGSGWDEWAPVLLPLAGRWAGASMTAHPRLEGAREAAQAAGWRWQTDWRELLAHANVVVWDVTSVGFMAAVLGIPTIALDSARWRPEVDHGLRHGPSAIIPGLRLRPGDDLAAAVDAVLADPALGLQNVDAVRDAVCAPQPGWQQAYSEFLGVAR